MRMRGQDGSPETPHLPSPRGADSPFDAVETLTSEELRQRLRSLEAILEVAPVPIAIAHDRSAGTSRPTARSAAMFGACAL